MKTLAGATMSHFSLGAQWLDKAIRLKNGSFEINDTSIKELWDEAVEICGVVERIAGKANMTISDLMEQGKKAGHRKTRFVETVDKSEDPRTQRKPKDPVSDPRISPFAKRPEGIFPKIDPLGGFRLPEGLEPIRLRPQISATTGQRGAPGRQVAESEYKMAVAKMEGLRSESLSDPALRADYIKLLTDANRLAAKYSFPVVISKIGAGKDLRKETAGFAQKQNAANIRANAANIKGIKRATSTANGVRRSIAKRQKKAVKKNDAAQAKLSKATATNRAREANGRARKNIAGITAAAHAALKDVDKVQQEQHNNSQDLTDLKGQAQSSAEAKTHLNRQAADLKHDIKMADREMDLSDARARRFDMSTATGKRMIQSLKDPSYGLSMEQELEQFSRGENLGKRPIDVKQTRRGKRLKPTKPKSAEEKDQERREIRDTIERQQSEARLTFMTDRAGQRKAEKRKLLQETEAKLSKWAVSAFESEMGLRLVPEGTFGQDMQRAEKKVYVDDKEANSRTRVEWEDRIQAKGKEYKDLIKFGTIAQQKYNKTIGKQPGLTSKQKKVLLTDVFPYADKDSLPAHYRVQLERSFVPEMKKLYPSAGWKDFNPDQPHTFGGTTGEELKSLLAKTRGGKVLLTPETNLLLLKIMGYPREVQDNIRGEINKTSTALGDLQKEAIRVQIEVQEAKAAEKARRKLDNLAKKEAKKSKVQKMRRRATTPPTEPRRREERREEDRPRARSQSPRARSPKPKPRPITPKPKVSRPRSRTATGSPPKSKRADTRKKVQI